MHQQHVNRINDQIVSISQPHVRPIKRVKAHGIRLSGPRLGRPPKLLSKQHQQQKQSKKISVTKLKRIEKNYKEFFCLDNLFIQQFGFKSFYINRFKGHSFPSLINKKRAVGNQTLDIDFFVSVLTFTFAPGSRYSGT